jgi:hypothetical protein
VRERWYQGWQLQAVNTNFGHNSCRIELKTVTALLNVLSDAAAPRRTVTQPTGAAVRRWSNSNSSVSGFNPDEALGTAWPDDADVSLLGCNAVWTCTNVSEEHTASIFRATKDGDIVFFSNACIHPQVHTESQQRRQISTFSQPSEPQISISKSIYQLRLQTHIT